MTKNGTYLQLTLYTQTRPGHNSRGPQGDEDGDGRLGALEKESEARNATILLYADAAGINGNAKTTIDYALYAPTLTKTDTSPVSYKTDILHYSRPVKPGLYHVIVIVNAGDRTDLEGKTLGEVRDERMGAPYLLSDPNDPTSAHTFVMSNEKDATIDLTGPGGVQNVKTVEVDVERLAARIDFSPGVSYATAGSYYGGKMLENKEINGTTYPTCFEYRVLQEGTTNTNGDLFYLTSVQPINLWTNRTYLIKRVSDIKWADENHLIYLGDETTNALGEASRYVLSPYFFQRKKGYESQFAVSYGNGAETPPKEGVYKDPADEKLKYYILTYARENTISYNAPVASYATALRLKGFYLKDGTSTYTEKTYTYYIRHADPNNTNAEAVPMKYGIVRNNVYRISINRVNSLGVMIIETKDWITKELPPIYM